MSEHIFISDFETPEDYIRANASQRLETQRGVANIDQFIAILSCKEIPEMIEKLRVLELARKN